MGYAVPMVTVSDVKRRSRDAMDRMAKVGPRAAATARGTDGRAGLLTVTEAAIRLGITKPEVRTLLKETGLAARTKPKKVDALGHPLPNSGVYIPENLLGELEAAQRMVAESIASAPAAPETVSAPAEKAEEPPQQAPETPPTPRNDSVRTEMPIALVYERLLAEKDARIGDLQAEIEHLRGFVEREQAAHSRAQALLALQSPLRDTKEPD
jgi:hypothetical protein